MRIVSSINNNYALAEDENGEKLIVCGKGIGYGRLPRNVSDMSQIERTYYGIDTTLITLLKDLPKEIIDISSLIIEKGVSALRIPVNPNLVFTLADHINFAIQRYQKHISIQLPILRDIQQSFPKETAVGTYSLKIIKDRLKINLPKEEALLIAMHVINSEYHRDDEGIDDEKVLENITKIIEKVFNKKLDRSSFNYSRFATHISYLLKRSKNGNMINSQNALLSSQIFKEYPLSKECADSISKYFIDKLNITLTNEEKMYLVLHINRVCTRVTNDE